ncbi:MAG: bifunctional diaminohydroxyphosphoribosylaminopyrimidine deaminase/5-amino-6-(5-phosphoribosylamino)uracil reductase RibD [Paludibacter sp.]
MECELKYMLRCLQLAELGGGYTSPNPMVGAVLVCDDVIIGEGYHHRYGEPHAEPNAINSVVDKDLLKLSTLYVNLEPCSHYGKTPPCANLIVSSGIPRVVIGTFDPNPRVAGSGVEILRNAGIDVTVGMLETECRELNKRFFIFQEQKRPVCFVEMGPNE